MLETGVILFVSFGYMGLLFAIAHYGDKRADAGRSIISNSYIYALSLAVYCNIAICTVEPLIDCISLVCM